MKALERKKLYPEIIVADQFVKSFVATPKMKKLDQRTN